MMVSSESYMMFKALDWIVNQAQNSRTAYYGKVNVDQVAAMGMSCGGCQAIYLSCDPRVTTLVVLNSGMGTMTLANATPRNVKAIHCPTVYITGGEADIAYKNAEVDYNTLTDVPVAWMNLPVGHGGTYAQEFGGDFARMARAWLDYTMKGRTENERIFKQLDLTGFDGWTAQSKNFK
jgi:dienelactone hydrolase